MTRSTIRILLLCRTHQDLMEETKTVEPDPAYLMEPIPDDEKQINELLQKESVRLNPSLFSFS